MEKLNQATFLSHSNSLTSFQAKGVSIFEMCVLHEGMMLP